MMDDNLEFIVRGKGSDISNDFLEPIVIPIETHVAKLGLKKLLLITIFRILNKGRITKLKLKFLVKTIMNCFL